MDWHCRHFRRLALLDFRPSAEHVQSLLDVRHEDAHVANFVMMPPTSLQLLAEEAVMVLLGLRDHPASAHC